MKYILSFFVLSITISCSALIKAPEFPQAKELIYDSTNANHIYVIAEVPESFDIKGARITAFESYNAGDSFAEISPENIPYNYPKTNPFTNITYSIVREENNENNFTSTQCIIRSKNGGHSWDFTNYKKYIEKLKKDSDENCITRITTKCDLPDRIGFFRCRQILKMLTITYCILILLFFWRTGWFIMLLNLVKSLYLIIIIYFIMGYVYYKYDDFILLSTDHFGNLTLLLLYLATWPKALIVGFLIFAVTAPSTIAIFRYKRPVDKWQKNWIFLTWDSIALIIWIIILFAVQQFSFSVMG